MAAILILIYQLKGYVLTQGQQFPTQQIFLRNALKQASLFVCIECIEIIALSG